MSLPGLIDLSDLVDLTSDESQSSSSINAGIHCYYKPDLGPNDNPVYYETNRLLFELHLARIQRTHHLQRWKRDREKKSNPYSLNVQKIKKNRYKENDSFLFLNLIPIANWNVQIFMTSISSSFKEETLLFQTNLLLFLKQITYW